MTFEGFISGQAEGAYAECHDYNFKISRESSKQNNYVLKQETKIVTNTNRC
jgi:hypothetical protein